jgi:hypothetical protein
MAIAKSGTFYSVPHAETNFTSGALCANHDDPMGGIRSAQNSVRVQNPVKVRAPFFQSPSSFQQQFAPPLPLTTETSHPGIPGGTPLDYRYMLPARPQPDGSILIYNHAAHYYRYMSITSPVFTGGKVFIKPFVDGAPSSKMYSLDTVESGRRAMGKNGQSIIFSLDEMRELQNVDELKHNISFELVYKPTQGGSPNLTLGHFSHRNGQHVLVDPVQSGITNKMKTEQF